MINVAQLLENVSPKSVAKKESSSRAPKITPEIEELAALLIEKADEIGGESNPFPWASDYPWKTVSFAVRKLSEEKYILASAGKRNSGKNPTLTVNGVEYPAVKIAKARHPNRKK